MSNLAANLVDRVLPRVPVRHWVFSLPFYLRPLVAYRPAALQLVLNTYLDGVFEWIRARTRLAPGAKTQGAAVTVTQRAGGAINLNPHFHSVIPEGMFVEGPGARPRFVKMRHPREDEIRDLEAGLATKALDALREAGYMDSEGTILAEEDDARPDAHSAIVGAALTNQVAVGDRTGMRVEREISLAAGSSTRRNFEALGFSLFVGNAIAPSRRGSLERLCRYLSRPAVAQERLSWTSEGKIRYELSHPRPDGTVAVLFTPVELLEKLAAIVPRPRTHLVHYHGVLAPNAAWRKFVAPHPPEDSRSPQETANPPPRRRSPWIPWADLLRRVFAIDVLQCDRCGGRRQVIAFLTDPEVVVAILTRLGLPSTPPSVAPAGSRPRRTQARRD